MKNFKIALIAIGSLSFLLGISIGHIQHQQSVIEQAGLMEMNTIPRLALPTLQLQDHPCHRERKKKTDQIKITIN
ncbi:MAG: hypothetical protein DHS20C18_18970 [Saprospiraceae bacterium]|nr:MAG: hypothetical protein DHS20C18_18970 [Saprospiraceae bacterium]